VSIDFLYVFSFGGLYVTELRYQHAT